jgi:hypothetical protein
MKEVFAEKFEEIRAEFRKSFLSSLRAAARR